jgi:Tol biopolymer transport system component
MTLVTQAIGGGPADGDSSRLEISADGDYAVFQSDARDLVPDDGVTHGTEVFEANLVTGQITRVSVSATGGDPNGSSTLPSVSADGTYVAFVSDATDLTAAGSAAKNNVFVRNMTTGVTTQVSLGTSGQQPNGYSTRPSISADGSEIAFDSTATDLSTTPVTKGFTQVYLTDMETGTTTLESVNAEGDPGNADSLRAALSSDASNLVYVSDATNLTSVDTGGVRNVYELNLASGVTQLVSVGLNGEPADATSSRASVSDDGQFVSFESRADNLVAGITGHNYQVYLRDTVNNVTTLVSVNYHGKPGISSSTRPSISGTGQYIAFQANAPMSRDATNHERDIYIRDVVNNVTYLVDYGVGGAESNAASVRPSISDDGTQVIFASAASNLTSQGGNGYQQIYLATFSS